MVSDYQELEREALLNLVDTLRLEVLQLKQQRTLLNSELERFQTADAKQARARVMDDSRVVCPLCTDDTLKALSRPISRRERACSKASEGSRGS